MMQEQSYGIPYAMHVHDIERLENVSFHARNPDEGKETPFRNMVNIRLGQGWKVLLLFSDADNEPAAIMGVPHIQYCHGGHVVKSNTGRGIIVNGHLKTIKAWDHQRTEWYCTTCLQLGKDELERLSSPDTVYHEDNCPDDPLMPGRGEAKYVSRE